MLKSEGTGFQLEERVAAASAIREKCFRHCGDPFHHGGSIQEALCSLDAGTEQVFADRQDAFVILEIDVVSELMHE